jgi:diphosphomevalonate decarboxylase
VNAFLGETKVAYTFDAGPNACIYLLEDFVPTFIGIVNHFFPKQSSNGTLSKLDIKGKALGDDLQCNPSPIIKHLEQSKVIQTPNSVKYLINTSIGDGPQLVNDRTSALQ